MGAAILKCIVGLIVMLMGLFLIVTPLIIGMIFLVENHGISHRAENFAFPAAFVCWFVGGVTTITGLLTVLFGLKVKHDSAAEQRSPQITPPPANDSTQTD